MNTLPELPIDVQRMIYRQKIKADDMTIRKKTWRRVACDHHFVTNIRGIKLKHVAARLLIERRIMVDEERRDWNMFIRSKKRGTHVYRMAGRLYTHFAT